MSFRIATFNVHRLQNSKGIEKLLLDNNVEVCGLQEASGLKALENTFGDKWKCLFDNGYPNYGNGLVYRIDKFELVECQTHILKGKPGKKTAFQVILIEIESKTMLNI